MPHLISFDLSRDALERFYGTPCNGAYGVLRDHFVSWGFVSLGGTVYVCLEEGCDGAANLAIDGLRYFEWFTPSCTRFVAGPFILQVTLDGLRDRLSGSESSGQSVVAPEPP